MGYLQGSDFGDRRCRHPIGFNELIGCMFHCFQILHTKLKGGRAVACRKVKTFNMLNMCTNTNASFLKQPPSMPVFVYKISMLNFALFYRLQLLVLSPTCLRSFVLFFFLICHKPNRLISNENNSWLQPWCTCFCSMHDQLRT